MNGIRIRAAFFRRLCAGVAAAALLGALVQARAVPASPVLDVSGDMPQLRAGQTAVYTFTLTNNSQIPAEQILLQAAQPAPGGGITGGAAEIAHLAAGASAQISLAFVVPQDAQAHGTLRVTASYRYRMADGSAAYVDGNAELNLPYTVVPAAPETHAVTYIGQNGARVTYAAQSQAPGPVLLSAYTMPYACAPGAPCVLRVVLLLARDQTAQSLALTCAAMTYGALEIDNAPTFTRQASELAGYDILYADYAAVIGQSAATASYAVTASLDSSVTFLESRAQLRLQIADTAATPPPTAAQTPRFAAASQNQTRPNAQNLLTYTLRVENPTAQTLYGLTVTTGADSTLSISGGPAYIDVLPAYEAREVTLTLYAGADLAAGNHAVSFDLIWTGQTVTHSAFALIARAEATATPPPDRAQTLRLTRYDTSAPVQKGQAFTLTFTLANPASSAVMRNVRVALRESEFTVVSGASAFYLDVLEPGAQAVFELPLLLPAIDTLKESAYAVPLRVTYQDEQGAEQKQDFGDILLPIVPASRLQIGDINFWAYEPNAPGELYFGLISDGGADVYNIELEISGPFTVSGERIYLGNLGAGQYNYPQLRITPTQTGQIDGQLHVRYEDAQGEEHRLSRPFSGYIYEYSRPEPEPEPEPKSLFGWKVYAALGGAAVVAVLIIAASIIGARRRRKRTLAFELEE